MWSWLASTKNTCLTCLLTSLHNWLPSGGCHIFRTILGRKLTRGWSATMWFLVYYTGHNCGWCIGPHQWATDIHNQAKSGHKTFCFAWSLNYTSTKKLAICSIPVLWSAVLVFQEINLCEWQLKDINLPIAGDWHCRASDISLGYIVHWIA